MSMQKKSNKLKLVYLLYDRQKKNVTQNLAIWRRKMSKYKDRTRYGENTKPIRKSTRENSNQKKRKKLNKSES